MTAAHDLDAADAAIVEALEFARHLAEFGVPIFVAPRATDRDGSWNVKGGPGNTGYVFPKGWQNTKPDPAVVDTWEPGMALCAVTGRTPTGGVDVIDIDPRNGGDLDELVAELDGNLPTVYGRASTPSGGEHLFVAPLGVAKGGLTDGIDYQAGVDGTGHGFVFLAPTRKRSKADNKIHPYAWTTPPGLDFVDLDGDSGAAVREMLVATKPPASDRPAFDPNMEVTEAHKAAAFKLLDTFANRLRRAEGGDSQDTFIRWLPTLYQFVLAGAIEQEEVDEIYLAAAHERGVQGIDASVESAWRIAHRAGADLPDLPSPPEEDFAAVAEPADSDAPTDPALSQFLGDYKEFDASDLHTARKIADKHLRHKFRALGERGWAYWTGTYWDVNYSSDRVRNLVSEHMRLHHEDLAAVALKKKQERLEQAKDDKQRKAARATYNRVMEAIRPLLSKGKSDAIMAMVRAHLQVDLTDFDGPQTRHLLNCPNGVVDLRTGELRPHDQSLYFTQITRAAYKPEATHADWDQALLAVPDDVHDYLQRRFGQALFGAPPTDDVVPFLYGSGENGKTSIVMAVFEAMGQFAVFVPQKVLMSRSFNEHDAIWMPFRGRRLALLEEMPGGDRNSLDDERLKSLTGAKMTGRGMRENPVTWDTTHSLFVTTNHSTYVSASDHGTRRRLARIPFPFTFNDAGLPRDPGLRSRLKYSPSGQHEAVLAWMVRGAVSVHQNALTTEEQPEKVKQATREWWEDGNPAERFAKQFLTADRDGAVVSSDVYAIYKEWARDTGQAQMSDRVFWQRMAGTDLFADDNVKRPKGTSRTKRWAIQSAQPIGEVSRLVTGLAYTSEARELLKRTSPSGNLAHKEAE